MKLRTLVFLSTLALASGITWYAYFNEWIILRNPWQNPTQALNPKSRFCKKMVSLFFWRHDRWHTETVSLNLTDDTQEQALCIVQAWVHEAVQLNVMQAHCTLEAALFDTRTQCIYLSFSASPFDTQKATSVTLTVIESLFKTIVHNMPNTIQRVQFLVHHVPLEHPHIECTRPMSISGFGVTHT